ncbi:HIRAN domain-containing protein [Modestobacter sp. DSM 44400]|uniref:HIRAN domain-containing protein n=1 Tax=Modestobacter sp. DSM 44400 TaxID=1550230 RepID=UPI0015872AD2|nr:HIRAN domain-containing protein [Modestobacter sp. DSM 44400]
MVDLSIVGEAAYQDYIRLVNRRAHGGEFEIVLRPEPNNQYDANAVAVLVDGKPVGYLPRAMARVWQPAVRASEAAGYVVAGTACVAGGTEDAPNLGVFGSAPWPGDGPPPKGRFNSR